ncbi:hypothetical protein MLD38_036148 [Melastoma candidum]|uniref:Uncharacterized protein n=1 Tax=Melastoma candidum TaxID=119954 RepID=A0ACB9LKN3_9MYRT|nr:hypothetical protein MLD38_036148 [Melastoma candidum]
MPSSVMPFKHCSYLLELCNTNTGPRRKSLTLATIDEDADIQIYINCPGGSTYSVLAIYDCMSWIKPKVGTVCFGVAASQGALLLAGGEKGMRYAMPNARIMIHQPQSGCGGHVEDVRGQVNEAVQSRHKTRCRRFKASISLYLMPSFAQIALNNVSLVFQ